jgi:hypothetical protein
VQLATIAEERSAYEELFSNADDVRRMVILKEIFDKPLALRR